MKLDVGLSSSGIPVKVDLAEYNNMHVNIDGASGTGKSTLLRNMASQIPPQGGHVVFFDASGDSMLKTLSDIEGFQTIDVRSKSLSYNPLLQQVRPSGQLEQLVDVGFRFSAEVRGSYAITAAQEYYLANSVNEYLLSNPPPHSIRGFVSFAKANGERKRQLATSLARLDHLSNAISCGEDRTPWDFPTPGITVLLFGDVPSVSLQALISEIILEDVLYQRMTTDNPDKPPLILVFDEAHRFNFAEGSSLVRLLREGRRFGMAGWFATQYITKPAAVDALGNVGLRIQFCPAKDPVKVAGSMARGDKEQKSSLLKELPNLRPGEFFIPDRNGKIWKVVRNESAR